MLPSNLLVLSTKILFLLVKAGAPEEKSVVCVENGHYLGFGFIDETFSAANLQDFKDVIKRYNDNKDVQQIIRGYMRTHMRDKLLVF